MDKKNLEQISIEVAILIRRATSTPLEKKYGNLDRSAYLLLHELSTKGPSGVKALAEEFRLDISTVSRQTAALEAKGYANRLSDPTDGRASFFQITELGMRELTETKQARIDRFSKLFRDWPEDDIEKFLELLSKLNRTYIE